MSLRKFVLTLVLLGAGSAQAATLPANFYETIIHNGTMTNPTAMAIAPDGRVFVCLQGGTLRVIKNGALLATPFFTIPAATISSVGERGLLGVAFDPNFSGNRYVYIYSTHIEPSGTVTFAGATTVSGPVTYNRVTRLTADAAAPDTALAGSEVLILNMYPLSAATNHNGGAMHFGSDGKLYIAAGENASGPNAQTLANLLGKISRINVDGSIPVDNPFYGTAAGNNQAIWVMGLRNPFTFNFHSVSGRLFINDVGQNTWEEINDGIKGANYGWPGTEGGFVPASFPTYTHPTFYYNSAGTGPVGTECAITGGTFYTDSMFPAPYPGKYFFADYCGGWIRYINPPAAGVTLDPTASTGFATGYTAPVGLEVGPDGALYVLTGANTGNGRVYRIHYSTSTAPVISTNPASVTVTAGQNASFTVVAAGAAPITYQWIQNGVTLVGNSPSYTLNNAQLSNNGDIFRVFISNASGTTLSAPATLFVTTNTPPVPTIVLPSAAVSFNAGTTITFSGSATDAQDGTLGPLAFTWWIDLHHDLHTHPAMGATYGVTTGTFVIPNVGETSDNIWYRIYLAVTDSGGMAVTVYREIYPNKANLVFFTNPAGLDVTLEGIPLTTPATVVSVVGMIRDFGATSPQGANVFTSWSDGGAQSHFVTVGAASVTYTANFATPTPTFTRTFTRTFTPTFTPTFTRTFTPSFTATFTPTFTRTFTPSFTSTFTPSLTGTFTPSFTRTFTSTFTGTASPTPTPTLTSAATNTFTPSATATQTPSFTPTSTRTFTATFTPSFTRTFTPTFTPTFSATPTATPTFTFTFTPTITPTPSPTATGTLTPTDTSTITPTPSDTPTSTDTPTFTLTFTETDTFTETNSPTPSPTLTATLTPVFTSTFTYSPTATFTPSHTMTFTITPSFTLTETPSFTPTSTPTPGAYLRVVSVQTSGGALVKTFPTQPASVPVTAFTLIPNASISSLYDQVYVDDQGNTIGAWDGTNGVGDPVANGTYILWVESVGGGVTTVATQSVTVSRVLNTLTVNILNSSGVTVRHLYSFVDDPLGYDPIAGLQVSSPIFDPGAGGLVSIVSSGGLTLVWDGRNDATGIVAPGCYYVDARFDNGSSVSRATLLVAVVSGPGATPTCPPLPAPPASPGTVQFDPPYPNPASDAPVRFSVALNGFSQVRWSVFTLAYRKIFEGGTALNSSQTLSWDLKDKWGTPAANGLYYLRIEVEGPSGKSSKIWKVLIRR